MELGPPQNCVLQRGPLDYLLASQLRAVIRHWTPISPNDLDIVEVRRPQFSGGRHQLLRFGQIATARSAMHDHVRAFEGRIKAATGEKIAAAPRATFFSNRAFFAA